MSSSSQSGTPERRLHPPTSADEAIRQSERLTILGGGPAGLAVAFYARRAGVPFVLYEKSDHLGGLCRTFQWGDHRYDSGAHRFHDRYPDITNDIRALLGGELVEVKSPSKILDQGRFVDFPPTPRAIIFSKRDLADSARIGIDILRSRWKRRPIVTFKDFAVAQFGEILGRRLLLNYSEKLWGLPADQLSPDIATRRLQGMTVGSFIVESLFPWRKTTHIDGKFLYPKMGYGRIIEKLSEDLPPSSVITGREVIALDCEGPVLTRIRFADRQAAELSGTVVSTLPLPLIARLLSHSLPEQARTAALQLRFRQIRLFFIRLDQPKVSDSASIYIPDPRFSISRIYEPKNRSRLMAPENETSLVVEVPCFETEPLFAIDVAGLAGRVVNELVQLGLIDQRRVVEWRHHLLANAYPVYSLNYAAAVKAVRDSLSRLENLHLLGRGGLFFYSHLHDQLRLAKTYVEQVGDSDTATAEFTNTL